MSLRDMLWVEQACTFCYVPEEHFVPMLIIQSQGVPLERWQHPEMFYPPCVPPEHALHHAIKNRYKNYITTAQNRQKLLPVPVSRTFYTSPCITCPALVAGRRLSGFGSTVRWNCDDSAALSEQRSRYSAAARTKPCGLSIKTWN